MRESKYQSDIKKRIALMLPGSIVFKGDSSDIQGIPDLIILYGDRWAALEVKTSWEAPLRPNQEWYVEKMNSMSFAAFIYPDVEEEILYALQRQLTD